MPCLRPRVALLLLSLFAPTPLAAQLPPLTVPKGHVRLDLGGRFDNWDQTWFGGVKRDAARDFSRDPVTGAWLPGLAETEQRLRQVSGVSAVSLSLGKTSANMLVNIGTESIGAAYGLTSRLTLFGTIPYVRVRVQEVFRDDSTGATAGFNPAHPLFGTPEGPGRTAGFLDQLRGALSTLNSALVAGTFDNDAATKAFAQATLARGTQLESDLQSLLIEAFLPLAGTPAAATLLGTLDSLRTRLTALAIAGFTSIPDLPLNGIPPGGLASYATNPQGPVAAQPFEPPILRYIGDIEVGAAFEWLDHRPAGKRLAVRSVLQGTVRLRTGKLDRPDALFDLGTGERQPDVQGDLVTDFGIGRFGARVTARYVLQLPGRQLRRLSPPDQPIALAASLAAVERDPGEIVEGAFEPYVRLAPHLAIVGGVRYWSKGIDQYQYVEGQAPIPGTTPDVLAIGSKENGTVLSAGLSFSHDGARRDGKRGIPIDATIRGELVIGSSQGRVPVKQSIALGLRFYRKIF